MDCGTVGMVLSRSRWPPLSRDWELPGTSTRDGPVEDVVEEVGDGVLVGWRRRLALDVRSWMTELAWHSPRWQDWNRGKERVMRGPANESWVTAHSQTPWSPLCRSFCTQ